MIFAFKSRSYTRYIEAYVTEKCDSNWSETQTKTIGSIVALSLASVSIDLFHNFVPGRGTGSDQTARIGRPV